MDKRKHSNWLFSGLSLAPSRAIFQTQHSLEEVQALLTEEPVYHKSYFSGEWRLKFYPGLHNEVLPEHSTHATYKTEMIVPSGRSHYSIYAQLLITRIKESATKVELETFFSKWTSFSLYIAFPIIPIVTMLIFESKLLSLGCTLLMYGYLALHLFFANRKRQQLIQLVTDLLDGEQVLEQHSDLDAEAIS